MDCPFELDAVEYGLTVPPSDAADQNREDENNQDHEGGATHSVPPALAGDLPAHLTSGHASWPQVVEVMERIRSRTRTQGADTAVVSLMS
jgi:hypothetical protein